MTQKIAKKVEEQNGALDQLIEFVKKDLALKSHCPGSPCRALFVSVSVEGYQGDNIDKIQIRVDQPKEEH